MGKTKYNVYQPNMITIEQDNHELKEGHPNDFIINPLFIVATISIASSKVAKILHAS